MILYLVPCARPPPTVHTLPLKTLLSLTVLDPFASNILLHHRNPTCIFFERELQSLFLKIKFITELS